jgi:ArsR family metal-binding transcriptional regulator
VPGPSPRDPGAERYAANAHLTFEISEVLPYLDATLRGAVYHRSAQALTWKKGGHNIAFYAHEIATRKVECLDGAPGELKELLGFVNRAWVRPGEITPATTARPHPIPMANYRLLPNKNRKTTR